MINSKQILVSVLCTILTLDVLALGAIASPGAGVVSAQGPAGTIAYVRAGTGDEIRLVEPDGRDDRRLWTHGLADPHEVYEIRSLAWRPDSAEIAFESSHESWCSIYEADIFTVRADGSRDRRITQAPACDALAGFLKGTVRVPVENWSSESVTGFLYFQGAPGPQPFSLPAGGNTVVTFDDVADLGEMAQYTAALLENDRTVDESVAADVQAGGTVQTPAFVLSGGLIDVGWEVRSPTWRRDGSRLGYVRGFNELFQVDATPDPLDRGDPLVQADIWEMPDFVNHVAWGPTAGQAGGLLYASYEAFDSTGISLVAEGSSTRGESLVSYDATSFVAFILGLAWLPDGSGFVYSVLEDEFYEPNRANVYEYTFATKQVRPLTTFAGDFAGRLSVSPDGSRIVFERAGSYAAESGQLVDPDLWVMNRDGSGQRLLVKDARSPAWSPGALPASPRFDHSISLPLVLRGR